jgi:hypothetical protein
VDSRLRGNDKGKIFKRNNSIYFDARARGGGTSSSSISTLYLIGDKLCLKRLLLLK